MLYEIVLQVRNWAFLDQGQGHGLTLNFSIYHNTNYKMIKSPEGDESSLL